MDSFEIHYGMLGIEYCRVRAAVVTGLDTFKLSYLALTPIQLSCSLNLFKQYYLVLSEYSGRERQVPHTSYPWHHRVRAFTVHSMKM